MPPAARPALDKALDSALNAVPPVPRFPLLLGFAVDQRMSSFGIVTLIVLGRKGPHGFPLRRPHSHFPID